MEPPEASSVPYCPLALLSRQGQQHLAQQESNIGHMSDPMTKSNLSPEQQVASLWSLGGLGIKELGRRVYQGMFDDFLLDRAAALAFNFILALFPLLLFLLAVFGIFASHSSGMQQNLFAYLSQVLPPAASQVIIHTLREITKNAGGAKLTVGILLTLWFASGGMSSMMSGLDGVYEVKETRSFFKVRMIALGLTVAISLLILCALFGVLAGGWLTNWIGTAHGLGEPAKIAWRTAQIVVALVFVVFSFSLIYYY